MDDVQIVREALRSASASATNFVQIGTLQSAERAFDRIASKMAGPSDEQGKAALYDFNNVHFSCTDSSTGENIEILVADLLPESVSRLIRQSLQSAARPAVPEPTEEMWSGLARSIIMGRDLGCLRSDEMRKHLINAGWVIPEWLDIELPPGKHLAKGDMCVLIYKAMLNASREPEEAT